MAIEIFNRYEKKFLLDDKTYCQVIRRISEYMEPDSFNLEHEFYSIGNIYYDTADDELIRRSLAKPVYKEKLRLRAYGTVSDTDRAFLEIKKKYNGLVNKRRTTFVLKDAYEYMEEDKRQLSECRPYVNRQVLSEIDYFKRRYELLPKVYIAYERKAYFGREDKDFRITFDTNIRSRREELFLEAGSYGKSLLPKGRWLMEVKIKDAIPLWFVRILSELFIYPVSFSKYGTEYQNYIKDRENARQFSVTQQNHGGSLICLNQYLQQQKAGQALQQAVR